MSNTMLKRKKRKLILTERRQREKYLCIKIICVIRYLSVFCEENLSKGKKYLLVADYKRHDGKLTELTIRIEIVEFLMCQKLSRVAHERVNYKLSVFAITVTDDKAKGNGVPLRLTYPKEFWSILVSETKYPII